MHTDFHFHPEDEPLHAQNDIECDEGVKWNPRNAEEKGRETMKEEFSEHEEAKIREARTDQSA